MTALDLLLGIVRATVVSVMALALGRALLRRNPRSIAGVALAALLSGCVLLGTAGTTWPTIWQPSIGTGPQVGSEQLMDASLSERPRAGVSIEGFLLRLSRMDVYPAESIDDTKRWTAIILCVLGLPLVRIIWGLIATIRVHRSSQSLDDPRLLEILQCDRQSIDTFQRTFRTTARVDAPCVSAIDSHCVYLPQNWSEYSDDELAASVTHEFAHLIRHDARWRLVAHVATALQFFLPLSHRLFRQFVLGQELAADNWAVQCVGKARYIRGISQLALRLDRNATLRRPNGVGMSHSSSLLIQRIKSIRSRLSTPVDQRRRWWGFAAVLLVVLIAIGSAMWSPRADEPNREVALSSPSATIATSQVTFPWEHIPGHTGYWSLNVQVALKHAAIGPWIRMGDSVILNPAWAAAAKNEFAGSREDLRLSIENTIASLWSSHVGEIATLVARVPELEGDKATRAQKLLSQLHQSTEYFFVGLDRAETPSQIRLRIGVSVRSSIHATDVAGRTGALLKIVGDFAAANGATALSHLARQKPEVIEGQAGQPAVVVVTTDMPADLFLKLITD